MKQNGKRLTRKKRKSLVQKYYCFSNLLPAISPILTIYIPLGGLTIYGGYQVIQILGLFGVNTAIVEYFLLLAFLSLFPVAIWRIAVNMVKDSNKKVDSIEKKAWFKEYLAKSLDVKVFKQLISIFYAVLMIVYSANSLLVGSIDVGKTSVYLALITYLAIDKIGILDKFVSNSSSEKNKKIVDKINLKLIRHYAFYIRNGYFSEELVVEISKKLEF